MSSKIENRTTWKLLFVGIIMIGLTGCADTVAFTQAGQVEPVGFLHGMWHGMILPFAWICSLFSDGVSIYAIYNNGGWYDFGYFLGVGGFSASIVSQNKMHLLALIFPPLAVLMCGKPAQALLNSFFCLLFWIPGIIHALMVVSEFKADRRLKIMVAK